MKRDRKDVGVIMKSGFITHSMERLKKRTVRGESEEGGDNEGVTIREKTLLLTVIEMIMQRRGFDGDIGEMGRIADEIENECIEEIEKIREEEERRGGLEEEKERELDEWIEMKRLAGSISTLLVVKKRKGKMMTTQRMIEEMEERMKRTEEEKKNAIQKAEEEKKRVEEEMIRVLQQNGIPTEHTSLSSLSSLPLSFSAASKLKIENNLIVRNDTGSWESCLIGNVLRSVLLFLPPYSILFVLSSSYYYLISHILFMLFREYIECFFFFSSLSP